MVKRLSDWIEHVLREAVFNTCIMPYKAYLSTNYWKQKTPGFETQTILV